MKSFFSSLAFVLLVVYGNAQTVPYSFFIAGHTYGKPGVDNAGVHPPFKAKFTYIQNRTEIKFGIFTGDIVKQSTAQDWDEIDADVTDLGMPVYFAPGNHDGSFTTEYINRYGVGHSDFVFQNDLFLILNANGYGWNINELQLSFIDSVLDVHANSVDRIFVFFHQLLWLEKTELYGNVKPNSFEGRTPGFNFWTEVEPRFHALSNEVVMCAGDLGAASWASDFMYDNYDNITFIASGMGKGDEDNFVVINIDEQKNIDYDLICLNTTELNCFGEITDYEITDTYNHSFVNHEFSLFPNPVISGENVFIKVNSYNLTHVHVRNSFGQRVQSEIWQGQRQYRLSTNELPAGLYVIEFVTENNVSTQQLIVR
jgi:hypothetical protein